MSQANPTQKELNDYCQAYLTNGGNQSAAWRVAFPNSKAGDKVINEKASTLHQSGKVQERLEELSSKAAEKADKAFSISAEELLKRMVDVMDAGMTKQIIVQGESLVEKHENLPAVVSAGNAIAKLCGYEAPKEVDLSNKDGSLSPLTPEQRKLLDQTLGNDF